MWDEEEVAKSWARSPPFGRGLDAIVKFIRRGVEEDLSKSGEDTGSE